MSTGPGAAGPPLAWATVADHAHGDGPERGQPMSARVAPESSSSR
jgi:hypothetical protein